MGACKLRTGFLFSIHHTHRAARSAPNAAGALNERRSHVTKQCSEPKRLATTTSRYTARVKLGRDSGFTTCWRRPPIRGRLGSCPTVSSGHREREWVRAAKGDASPHCLERLEVRLGGDLVLLSVDHLGRSLHQLQDGDVRRGARLQRAEPGYSADQFRRRNRGKLHHPL